MKLNQEAINETQDRHRICDHGCADHRQRAVRRVQGVDAYAGLESMLQTRVETAYNILAVAKRHVPETDEAYQRVSMDLSQLDNQYNDLSRKAEANDALGRDAAALLKNLSQLDTVKNDNRDAMYVDNYLPQMLSESEQMTVGATYNQAAAEFNGRINRTFSGFLAKLMGVRPAEVFNAE